MSKQKMRQRRPEAEPWAILPSALHRILAWDRGEVTLEAADLGPTTRPPRATGQSIAVIPVTGVIEHHADWMMELLGGTAVDSLAVDFRAAMADPDVRAVVLDIDSPGGTVSGVQELAQVIREARGGDKPVVAVANAMAASAAYWLASQADEIVVTPSAQVGSIGVYSMHQDISGALEQEGVRVTLVSAGPHKTEGNMFEPLSDEGRADLQGRVDETYKQFVADVAAGRRVSADQVRADFGGGRVMTARAAVKAGMADKVETLDATLARLSRGRGRAPAARAELEAATHSLPADEARLLVELPSVLVGQLFEDVTTTTTTTTTTTIEVDDDDGGDVTPFSIQLALAAGQLEALVERATTRAGLRRLEGRPAYSTTNERSLRTIRDAIDDLLATDDPGASLDEPPADDPPLVASPSAADDPPQVAPVKPPPAAPPRAFRSREEWLQYVRTH